MQSHLSYPGSDMYWAQDRLYMSLKVRGSPRPWEPKKRSVMSQKKRVIRKRTPENQQNPQLSKHPREGTHQRRYMLACHEQGLGQVAFIIVDIGRGGEETGTLFIAYLYRDLHEPPRSCLWATCTCYLKSCYTGLLRVRMREKLQAHTFFSQVFLMCAGDGSVLSRKPIPSSFPIFSVLQWWILRCNP